MLVLALLAQITVENASQVKELATCSGHKQFVLGIAFSPDSKLLASGSVDTTVRLWEMPSGKQKALLEGHKRQATAVGFSGDGAMLVSAGYEPSVRVWDLSALKQIEDQRSNPKDKLQMVQVCNCVTFFSPDGAMLAYHLDGSAGMLLWDVKGKTQREIPTDEKYSGHFGYLAWSGDGKRIATAVYTNEDKSEIRVWDWKEGKVTATLTGPAGAFYGYENVAISRDGSVVAAVDSRASTIQLWDVKTGKAGPLLKGHAHTADEQTLILGLAFSLDGRVLASGSYDKTMRLWSVKDGKELASLAAAQTATVILSADGKLIAGAGLDGSIRVWGVK